MCVEKRLLTEEKERIVAENREILRVIRRQVVEMERENERRDEEERQRQIQRMLIRQALQNRHRSTNSSQ